MTYTIFRFFSFVCWYRILLTIYDEKRVKGAMSDRWQEKKFPCEEFPSSCHIFLLSSTFSFRPTGPLTFNSKFQIFEDLKEAFFLIFVLSRAIRRNENGRLKRKKKVNAVIEDKSQIKDKMCRVTLISKRTYVPKALREKCSWNMDLKKLEIILRALCGH